MNGDFVLSSCFARNNVLILMLRNACCIENSTDQISFMLQRYVGFAKKSINKLCTFLVNHIEWIILAAEASESS